MYLYLLNVENYNSSYYVKFLHDDSSEPSLAVRQQSPIGGFVPPGTFGNGESHPNVSLSFVTHALLVPARDDV